MSVCSPSLEVCRVLASLWAGPHDITLNAAITLVLFPFPKEPKVVTAFGSLDFASQFLYIFGKYAERHLNNMLQRWLQPNTYWLHNLLFCTVLVAGVGVPHPQECGPAPDHCQEAQLESLGPQQEARLEGLAGQQEAHQCIPLLASGLSHCSPIQCLERTKRNRFQYPCVVWHPKMGTCGCPVGQGWMSNSSEEQPLQSMPCDSQGLPSRDSCLS